MKRTVLSAGLISAMLLFSTSAMSSNNAPNSGEDDSAKFGFLKRTSASLGPHYFTVRVTAETFSRQFSTDAIQSFGVNVYWKTKGYDQDKGRHNLSVTAPNLPRCPFKEERQCDDSRNKLRGNSKSSSEHLEGLVYSYLEIDNGIYIQGQVPDKFHRATRFFKHRYSGYEYPPANKQDDEWDDTNVRLSAIFFSQSDAPCDKAGSRFCGGQDGYQVPKDILISSNDLEYLVIEVIGFQHTNKTVFKNDAFYTFPVAAVKYVPTGQGKKMKVLRSDRHAGPGMGMEMFAGHFPSTPPNNNSGGYWDVYKTNIHGNAAEIDFTNIDILKVGLSYNPRYPVWENPQQTGIYFKLDKTDLICFPWADAKCIYPLK
ncbi:hypothetical protein ACX9P6_000913 [Citrobacter braakii]